MTTHHYSERVSRLARRMTTFLKEQFPVGDGLPIVGGLPAGSTIHAEAKLILCATCCTVPLFGVPLALASDAHECDAVIMRHGLMPEVLDDVRYDVAGTLYDNRFFLRDYLLYHGLDGERWLIPPENGMYVRLQSNGLAVASEPPFMTADERSDGLCRAAKLTAEAGRRPAHG